MKILNKILIVLGSLIALILIITFFLPSEFKVERTAEIKAPAYKIYYQIATMAYWEKWDPWMALDLKQKRTYKGMPSGIGSSYSFDSENSDVGKGTLTVINTIQPREIDISLKFDNMQDSSRGVFLLSEKSGVTQIKWTMEGKMSGFYKWFNFLIDGMVGKLFEKGLAKLKE